MEWEENGQVIEYTKGKPFYHIGRPGAPQWLLLLVFNVAHTMPYKNSCGHWPKSVNGGKNWALEPVE